MSKHEITLLSEGNFMLILLCFCLDVDLTHEVRCATFHLWCQVSGFESFEF